MNHALKEVRNTIKSSGLKGADRAIAGIDNWLKEYLLNQFISKVQNEPLKKETAPDPDQTAPSFDDILETIKAFQADATPNTRPLQPLANQPETLARPAQAPDETDEEPTHSLTDVYPEFADESLWKIIDPPEPKRAKKVGDCLGKPRKPYKSEPIKISVVRFWQALNQYKLDNQLKSGSDAFKNLGFSSLSSLGGLSGKATGVANTRYGEYLIKVLGPEIQAEQQSK